MSILTDYFYYDETSPSCLRWKQDLVTSQGQVKKLQGDVAGNINRLGYYRVKVFGKEYLCHRVIAEIKSGVELTSSQIVDHRDRNQSNNKFENLRIVLNVINRRNMKRNKRNTSGVTGVSLSNCKKYWVASCMGLDKKPVYKCLSIKLLGNDKAFSEACIEREKMMIELNNDGAAYSETHGEY